MNQLGVYWQARDQVRVAEPLYRRALAIGEQSLGPDHPTVATVLNNLAGLLWATNRPGEAEPLYRRALAINEQSLGPDHPEATNVLNNLARLLWATSRPDEAEPLFRRAVRILIELQRRTGYEHPNFRLLMDNYRGLLQAIGKTPEQIERQLHELAGSPRREGS
jgi:Tfp pilus assembly protein PilF